MKENSKVICVNFISLSQIGQEKIRFYNGLNYDK